VAGSELRYGSLFSGIGGIDLGLGQKSSQLTFYAEGSLVSQFPLQESVVELMMKGGSGTSSTDSFASLDQGGSWLRMSQDSYQQTLDGRLQEYSGTWPRAGMMLSGTCIQREDQVALVRRTEGKESLLWPTPTAVSRPRSQETLEKCLEFRKKSGRTSVPLYLEEVVKMWPTPRVSDTEGGLVKNVELRNGSFSRKNKDGVRWGVKLKDAVGHMEMWPTPSASDNRDRGHLGSGAVQRRMAKGKQIMLSQSVSTTSGALNPTWVEWLMGFPIGWTDLEHLETESSPKSPTK
jgi:hypothetical protein